jgi:carboxyl-terminal processing protease
MLRRLARTALLVAVALLAACTKRDDPCSNDNLKVDTAQLVGSWYLYPELLPSTIDLGGLQTPAEVLDVLTATAQQQGKDRGWSYVTTTAAQQQFFAEGTFVGFGFSVLVRGTQLFVAQVYPSSAASVAGFKRGDEIVAVGTADPLTPVSTLISNDAQCQAGSTPSQPCNSLGDAFGPATVGIQRLFDVVPLGGSTVERRPMVKASYGLDPVATPSSTPAGATITANGAVIIDRASQALPPAGYLALRTFIAPAEARLAAVFADFQAAGVEDVIVDVRYNGGGLLSTADVLLNLLGEGLQSNVMFALAYNRYHPDYNFIDYYAQLAGALTPAPKHVAFLVTNASASASELVPNALAPYRSIALVGHQTYGKPVGQRGFQNSQCGIVVYLVSFRLSNSQGNGDYFGGLPSAGFNGCGVAADDDLTHETWDPGETQTKGALDWLASQWAPTPPACATLSGPLSFTELSLPPDAYPRATRPTEAQRNLPGLF